LQHELRLEAYGHIQALDMEWFADRSRGGLMSVLNDDINQLERFLDKGANDLLQVATTVVVVGAIFFATDWKIALMAIAPIPVILWGSFKFQSRIQPLYTEVRQQVGHLGALLENNLDGILTIKAFTGESRERERVRAASERYRQSNRQAIRLSSAFVPLIRMAILVGFCATLLWGGVLTTSGAMAVGTYSVLVFLTQRLLWPLTRLGETFDLYQRAMASTTRVLDLISTPVRQLDGTKTPEHLEGRLVFDDVTFAYPDRPALLNHFNFEVAHGSTTAIVGSTGSGNSTLVRLLLRLYDPQSGAIRIGDTSVRHVTIKQLRDQIALVSQRVTLFPGTIRDNIRYGRPDATDTEIDQAATAAEAMPFILDLPQGIETAVGEGGVKLSGGQRQRISIARAVLKDAPILVLDEATSAVDNETESALQRSLAKLAEGRTTLVIAHRLSTVRHADRIAILEEGTLVESGTHDQLVKQSGRYATLWAVQTGQRVQESP
ncbi:MAG: ATP-binding cassette domain-containing protein, partial [Rhodobacterales bacterium]|nr:ATP-binding cassette domain-containing protein [Rhodobacterales bacterium]